MKKITLPFKYRPATAVLPTRPTSAVEIIGALDLPPYRTVLMVVGSAGNLNPELRPVLGPLFDAVSQVAHEAGAILLDGGTQAGVMALLGEAVARQGNRSALLGVTPAALVSYPGGPGGDTSLEPHHSHFVLTEGSEWGDETVTLFALTSCLAAPPTGLLHAAVLLVGGGSIAHNEMVQAARHRLPVLVISATGGLADELTTVWPNRQIQPEEPRLAEILADGRLQFFPLNGAPVALAQALRHLLRATE